MTPGALRRLRLSVGLSQRRMAAELGVHPMTVSKWDRAVQPIPEPVARLMRRIAQDRDGRKTQHRIRRAR